MDLIRNGRVVEHVPIVPAHRQSVHVGDVVMILTGKHAGSAGQVAGRLDGVLGALTWNVIRDDGVFIGRYPTNDLSILIEGS